MHIRIYYYKDTNPGGFTQPFSGIANEIWQGMNDANPNQPGDFYVDFGWREWIADAPEVTETGVKNGGVVFFDWERSAALLVLSPNAVTSSNIKAKLEMLFGVEYDGDGGYINADGSEWGFGNGQGDSNGCSFKNLPLIGDRLDFLCELEKFLWLGATVFLGMKALDNPNQNTKAAYGTAAAFTGYKSIQSFSA